MLQTWPAVGENGDERRDGPEHRPKIGPNAVLQLSTALRNLGLGWLIPPIYAEAGNSDWLTDPPTDMIDAQRAARAHRVLRENLPPKIAEAVLAEAGRLTAEYLLAHRIPKAVQVALRLLPPSIAARLLAQAMKIHAWTFVGAGAFKVTGWRYMTLEIKGNPLCAGETADHPVCAWHRAVFARLFDAVAPGKLLVSEVGCEARGDSACRFFVEPAPPIRPL